MVPALQDWLIGSEVGNPQGIAMSPGYPKGTASQREFPTVPSLVLRMGWWQWQPSVEMTDRLDTVVTGEAGLCPRVPARGTRGQIRCRDWGREDTGSETATGWNGIGGL